MAQFFQFNPDPESGGLYSQMAQFFQFNPDPESGGL
jgi:hypothetical protein